MADGTPSIEELALAVTEEVMARLAEAREGTGSRPARLWLLLVQPSGRLAELARLADAARASGLSPEIVVPPGLEALAGSGRALDAPGLERALAELERGDALLLLGLGFAFGRKLVELGDDDPRVRFTLRAMLRGLPALAADDDLRPDPAIRGALADRARELARALAALGLELRPSAELGDRLRRIRAGGTSAQALGGLVTEAEVEALVARGERRVRLGRGCLVTPLASSRAAELGLELVRQEETP